MNTLRKRIQALESKLDKGWITLHFSDGSTAGIPGNEILDIYMCCLRQNRAKAKPRHVQYHDMICRSIPVEGELGMLNLIRVLHEGFLLYELNSTNNSTPQGETIQ